MIFLHWKKMLLQHSHGLTLIICPLKNFIQLNYMKTYSAPVKPKKENLKKRKRRIVRRDLDRCDGYHVAYITHENEYLENSLQ